MPSGAGSQRVVAHTTPEGPIGVLAVRKISSQTGPGFPGQGHLMSGFIECEHRHQAALFPERIDDHYPGRVRLARGDDSKTQTPGVAVRGCGRPGPSSWATDLPERCDRPPRTPNGLALSLEIALERDGLEVCGPFHGHYGNAVHVTT